MKIVIDTHDKPEAVTDALISYLSREQWDWQVNNHNPIAQEPVDPNEPPECNPHHYMNGVCTKCHWLEI